MPWLVTCEFRKPVSSCTQKAFCFLGEGQELIEKEKHNLDLELNFELNTYPTETILMPKRTKIKVVFFFTFISGKSTPRDRRLIIGNKPQCFYI